MTDKEVDRAWEEWCRDVQRFAAWFDGDKRIEDTADTE